MSTTSDSNTSSVSTESPETPVSTDAHLACEPEALEEMNTDKQRSILLAASHVANMPIEERSISKIGQMSNAFNTQVKETLAKVMDRESFPAACRIASRCTRSKTYDDLTEKQRRIVNESVVNPDMSMSDVADVVDCSGNHVRLTRILYSDIIEEKRTAVCE